MPIASSTQTDSKNAVGDSRHPRRISLHLCFWLLLLLLSLRCFYLLADPPAGISASGDLYTDEGWWATNASAQYLTGHWYLPGGYNPAVMAPVVPLVESVVFALCGHSLLAARLVSLLFFGLTCLVLYRLVAGWENRHAAYLCLLLLAANYLVFASSRLAFLEMPMTFFAALSLLLALQAGKADEKKRYLFIGGVALAFLLAMLTKITAVFLLPVLLWLLLRNRGGMKAALLFLAIVLLLGGVYGVMVQQRFPHDVRAFIAANLTNKVPHTRQVLPPRSPLLGEKRSGGEGHTVNNRPLLALSLVMLGAGLLLLCVPSLRTSSLHGATLVWMICYLAVIIPGGYYPTRYFVHLAFPACLLLVLWLTKIPWQGWGKIAVAGIVLAVIVPQLYLTVQYLVAPRYSLLAAAQDIRQRVPAGSLLLGDQANTLGLLTQLPAMPESLGVQDLSTRLRQSRPHYYIRLGEMPPDKWQPFAQIGRPQLLATYPVFANYYTGEPLYLYQLNTR